MPRLRFTVRRLMIAVAIAAAVLLFEKMLYHLFGRLHMPESEDATVKIVQAIVCLHAYPIAVVAVIWRWRVVRDR